MSPRRASFLKSLCSHSCCAEDVSWACSSLSILPPYILYTCLKVLTRIEPLHMINCMTTTFLRQGLAQKNQGGCAQREVFLWLVPLSLHLYVCTQNPPSSSLCLASHTKWETIHTVFGFLFVVVLLILNLTSCLFVHLFSRALSNSRLCLFHSFPLH